MAEIQKMKSRAHPEFSCDLAKVTEPFPHFWEHTIGSGHATLALRADWQKQLDRCHRELGFQHVRFHGLLSDDMGTLMNENNKLVYSFFNADQIFDFLLSIGMKPFVELSFMPSALAKGHKTVFHYRGIVTPPDDFAAWATLIQKLVEHWVSRYGIKEVESWFFEVWNEPNLKAFWTGNKDDYFKLYQVTAKAIKAVDDRLKVGGPATANNSWIPEFIQYCSKHRVPVDFVSTHHYPTDSFGQPGDDTIAQLAASQRSVLREEAEKVTADAAGKPVYYTEWSTSSNPFDEMHDLPYAAAFITKTVMEARGLVKGYSYWTFSDIFEENYFSSVPFHGGFGLLNMNGIPKPSYRAYQLLHCLGDEILHVHGTHSTVDAWVVRNARKISIVITNTALPKHPIKTEMVQIHFQGVESISGAYVERIDATHSNSRRAWEKMGSPEYLSSQNVHALETASSLVKEPISMRLAGEKAVVQISMPAQGTAHVTLELESTDAQ